MKSTTFTITVPDTDYYEGLPAAFMRGVSKMTIIDLGMRLQPADKADAFVVVSVAKADPVSLVYPSTPPSPSPAANPVFQCWPDAVACDGKPIKNDARIVVTASGDRFEISQEAFCELQQCQRAGDAWHIFDRFADHICNHDRVAVWIACGSNNSPV